MIALFASIHHVLSAERRFRERGLWCDLEPAPRSLSTDCGMVLAFHARDLAAARAVLSDSRLRLRGLYRREGDAYVAAPDPRPEGDPGAG